MLLTVDDLHAGYGSIDVLRGVAIAVGAGELVAVLGANGAGKSTLLRAISNVEARAGSGSMIFDGQEIRGLPAERIVKLGLLHVPEGRQLFTELSVDDNLQLGGHLRSAREVARDVAATYERFPALAARRRATAFSLSGGEQQMLAIGRALVARPKLLMLDEPSTGLAPQIVTHIFAIIAELAAQGTAVLLVEQNAFLTLAHAARAYVVDHGEIVLAGSAAELASDARVQSVYLGGAAGV